MTSERRLRARLALQRPGPEPRFSLDVALDLGPGMNVLFGPSGSGKSTILTTIAGLLRPDVGHVALGDDVLFDSATRLDRPANERKIALVFQSLALFPHLDALSNVAYGLPRSLSKAEQREHAAGWLRRMRVEHVASRRPRSLAGGEAQRVALARALATDPRALLLDEPFSALDRELVHELCAELSSYVSAARIPVLLVTHDRALAVEVGGETTLLRAGRVVAVGPAASVLEERLPALRAKTPLP